MFDAIDSEKQPNLISYTLTGNAGGDEWKDIKVIFNGAEQPQTVKIPGGKWQVIAYDGKIDPNGSLGIMKGGKVSVPGTSALILARK